MENLEIFQGEPLDKWKEIVLNIDNRIIQKEMERLLDLLAVYEMIIEKRGLEAEIEEVIKEARKDELLKEKIKKHKNNLAISSMAEILSQNE